MDDSNWLARRFDENRSHLRTVAYRMLGSASEADDAVQDAWLRTSRADTHEVENLRGWLTTVIARVCLDRLRARRAHPEEPLRSDLEAASTHGPQTELAIAVRMRPRGACVFFAELAVGEVRRARIDRTVQPSGAGRPGAETSRPQCGAALRRDGACDRGRQATTSDRSPLRAPS
ncbi:MAG TPA: sigma factor [Kofleriaceae bacterium]